MINSQQSIKSLVWQYESKIPDKMCDLILEEFESEEYGGYYEGEVADGGDPKYRKVLKKQVPGTHWINGILYYYGMDANAYNFKFSASMIDQVDFLKYTKGMFYKPHQDSTFNMDSPAAYRKLTVILQLTDESEYSGGDLVLYNGSLEPIKTCKKRGSIVVFPSYVSHSIKPMKSGIRHSLVGWICGPAFA
jgi:PKHD-type hydroxylase